MCAQGIGGRIIGLALLGAVIGGAAWAAPVQVPSAATKLKVIRFGGLVGMPSPKRPQEPARLKPPQRLSPQLRQQILNDFRPQENTTGGAGVQSFAVVSPTVLVVPDHCTLEMSEVDYLGAGSGDALSTPMAQFRPSYTDAKGFQHAPGVLLLIHSTVPNSRFLVDFSAAGVAHQPIFEISAGTWTSQTKTTMTVDFSTDSLPVVLDTKGTGWYLVTLSSPNSLWLFYSAEVTTP